MHHVQVEMQGGMVWKAVYLNQSVEWTHTNIISIHQSKSRGSKHKRMDNWDINVAINIKKFANIIAT